MKMYYNYLNDRMEEVPQDCIGMNLPKSKEDYLKRLEERGIRDKVKGNALYQYKKEYPIFIGETFPVYNEDDNSIFPKDKLQKQLEYLKENPHLIDESWHVTKELEKHYLNLPKEEREMLDKAMETSAKPFEPNIKKLDMPTTTYPITNLQENDKAKVPPTDKGEGKRESFYDVRANQFAATKANNISGTMYCADIYPYPEEREKEEQEGVENYEVIPVNITTTGKALAIFILICGAVITSAIIIKAIQG